MLTVLFLDIDEGARYEVCHASAEKCITMHRPRMQRHKHKEMEREHRLHYSRVWNLGQVLRPLRPVSHLQSGE
jgi:hypothetical protein